MHSIVGNHELGVDRAGAETAASKEPHSLTEMKTLAAGRSHSAADILAKRLRALGLSQSNTSWNRAQYLSLLAAGEGPDAEIQGGTGQDHPKGEEKTGQKGETTARRRARRRAEGPPRR